MSLRHYHCAFFQKISNETLKGKCLLKNKHLPCSAYPRCADFVDKKDTTKAEATICYEACKEDSNALREEFIELVKETNKQKSIPYNEHLLSVEDKLESDKGVDLQYYKVKCANLETGYLDLQKENKKLKEGYKHHISELKGENEKLKKENKELQITKKFWKEQCSHTTNEHKNHYSINHCRCTADDFIHELRKGYKVLEKENKELKKRVSDLQKENYGNIDGIAFYQEENASLCEKISDLECENEDLKKENKGLKEQIKEFKRMPLLNMTNINKKLLEEIRHELVRTHGLYAYDSKYDEGAIHLNFKDLIEKIDDELEKEEESE